jgi:hypothetical protein
VRRRKWRGRCCGEGGCSGVEARGGQTGIAAGPLAGGGGRKGLVEWTGKAPQRANAFCSDDQRTTDQVVDCLVRRVVGVDVGVADEHVLENSSPCVDQELNGDANVVSVGDGPVEG